MTTSDRLDGYFSRTATPALPAAGEHSAPVASRSAAARAVAGLVAAVAVLAGCQSQTTFRTVDLTPPQQIDDRIPEAELLDVGIQVFDPNVPETFDEAQQLVVNAEVRRAESYYMPYVLKRVIESTGNWGAVRVVPGPTHAVDLLVTGRILTSQGERLELAVQARDARGVVWFDKTYHALASKYAYESELPQGADPFQHIYTRIADDLAARFVDLPTVERESIRRTAKMQFARDLVPAAYEEYVRVGPAGETQVVRLPATDDPMMRKVGKVRDREFLFIDTLDGHYAEYQRRVSPVYQTWRQAAYTQSMEGIELREKRRRKIVAGTISVIGGIAGGPATFSAIPTGADMLQDSFTQANEAELTAEALREISSDMENELVPFTLDLENRTVELSGTVEEQFVRLRSILRDSYYESLGIEPPKGVELSAR